MQTVPVKFLKSENSLQKKNVDLISAKSSFDDILFVRELIGVINTDTFDILCTLARL